MKDIILVHSGSRDNYQVAISLSNASRLKALITDDFFFRRHKPNIPYNEVRISYSAASLRLLNRLIGSGQLNFLKDLCLSRFAYRVAQSSSHYTLFAYSYYAHYAFRRFRGRKILFQLHPHPSTVRRIFEYEMTRNEENSASLLMEHELLLSNSQLNMLASEALAADSVIASSSFTYLSLKENGIDDKKVNIVPYGVDTKRFPSKLSFHRKTNMLNVIFVGSWNQRKGVSYLLSAVKKMKEDGFNVNLTIVGRGIKDMKLVKDAGENITWKSNISSKDLITEYHAADVFVFPSLCEGFGHVILEAMSCGLPVIATLNTAAADIITSELDGFIVPIRDVEAIVDKLKLLYNNPDVNIAMGKQASLTAQKYTWEMFRAGIIRAIDESK